MTTAHDPLPLPRRLSAVLLAALCLGCPSARADETPKAVGITAVSARVSKEYVRKRTADGSFEPEEYGFWDAGVYRGPFRDTSVTRLSFTDVARVIADALRSQNYVPARGTDSEKLLIVLQWGTTITGEDYSGRHGPGAHDDQVDLINARILGYEGEALIGTDFGGFARAVGGLSQHRRDLLAEIEENRYFVVMRAFDFQVLRRENRHRLLWETRFSINEPDNRFDRALPVIAAYASRYFGQDSSGLLRTQVPDGQVNVGVTKPLGTVELPGR